MNPTRFWPSALVAAWLACAGPVVQAASLSGVGTADDQFDVYLSTTLTPGAGDLVFSKPPYWSTTGSFSGVTLSPGQSVYLLVDAQNVFGGPAMFIADFSIAGSGFAFLNGGTTLSTDAVHWQVGESSFASATGTPYVMGANGPGMQIWGQIAGVATGTEAIWAYNADWANGYNGHAYFVTQIVAVPEPASAATLAAGLVLIGALALHRHRA